MKNNTPQSLDVLLSDIKDEFESEFYQHDDLDYYLEDRSRWMSQLIQREGTDSQDRDTDIHSLCIQMLQMIHPEIGKIIYEDDEGNIINLDSPSVVINLDEPSVNKRVKINETLDEEMGQIGMIFLKFCYDNLPQKEKIEYLKSFRELVLNNLKDEGEDVTDFPKLNKDKLSNELSDEDRKNDIVRVVDSFVESSNFDINNFLKKIGFTDLQMLDFFKKVMDDNVTS